MLDEYRTKSEPDISDPFHPDYDPMEADEDSISRWTDLEKHLEEYAKESEHINLEDIPDNFIPEKYSGYDSFKDEIEEETEQILESYEEEVEKERENRVDLSDHEIGIACDPKHAKDHDDAYHVQRTEDGYNIKVHIADVSHFVDHDSAIYEEMMKRAVTFYLGENTRHMAPPDLVENVFSLAPGEDRLAFTFDIDFDESGTQTDFDVYESIVRTENLDYPQTEELVSSATVDDVDPVYEDEEDNMVESFTDQELSEMMENVTLASELTDILRENRWDQSFILNEDTEASKIVEELMVDTNNGAGTFMKEQKRQGIYRRHEPPKDDFIEEVVELLEDEDYEPEKMTDDIYEEPRVALNNFFKPSKGMERGVNAIKDDEEHKKELRTEIVKKMKRARFSSSDEIIEAVPHDGQGIHNYAQVTSPIRRLPDLVNHFIMKDRAPDKQNIDRVADITTQIQIIADEASRVWEKAHT